LYPFIKGMAHINAEANLVLTEADPFCWGIRP
jgi:proline racemase